MKLATGLITKPPQNPVTRRPQKPHDNTVSTANITIPYTWKYIYIYHKIELYRETSGHCFSVQCLCMYIWVGYICMFYSTIVVFCYCYGTWLSRTTIASSLMLLELCSHWENAYSSVVNFACTFDYYDYNIEPVVIVVLLSTISFYLVIFSLLKLIILMIFVGGFYYIIKVITIYV